MSKKKTPNTNFPAWYYGPDGQAEIFNEEDAVPEGWADSPKSATETAPDPDSDATAQELYDNYKAAELRAICKARGIDFASNADKAALATLIAEKAEEGDDS